MYVVNYVRSDIRLNVSSLLCCFQNSILQGTVAELAELQIVDVRPGNLLLEILFWSFILHISDTIYNTIIGFLYIAKT